MRAILVLIGLVLILSGCSALSVSNLGKSPTVDSSLITVADGRTSEQKAHRRDSNLSPLVVLGDENVQPSAILFLESYIQKHQKQPSLIKVEIAEFYVIDFFPRRLKAATFSGGWLTDTIVRNIIHSNTDWAFVNDVGVPTDGDSVVCLFSGVVNGRAVKVAAFQEYHTSPMAVSIRNDSAFTEAVKSSLEKTAKEVISKIEN